MVYRVYNARSNLCKEINWIRVSRNSSATRAPKYPVCVKILFKNLYLFCLTQDTRNRIASCDMTITQCKNMHIVMAKNQLEHYVYLLQHALGANVN